MFCVAGKGQQVNPPPRMALTSGLVPRACVLAKKLWFPLLRLIQGSAIKQTQSPNQAIVSF